MFSSTKTSQDLAGKNVTLHYTLTADPCLSSIIDTIGFDDPSNDTDANIISELVLRLKNHCDHVNLFIIAVNGQNPRLDASLIGMIRIIEGMFGDMFWNQVVIVFTRMPMDAKSVTRRSKNSNGKSDDDLGTPSSKDERCIKHCFSQGISSNN